jgi:hypothetical protein
MVDPAAVEISNRFSKALNMKHTITLFFALAGAFAQAGLVFESNRVEQHAGFLDERAEAVFRFTNEGDAAVTIQRLQSTCGCTVPQLDKRVYAPGESGEIKAMFTFGARLGTQHKRVTVITDDRARPVHQLDFVTHIPQWADIQPKLLRWTLEQVPEPKEVRVRVTSPERVELAAPEGERNHFTIEAVPGGTDEQVFLVAPKSTATRVTERLMFSLTVTEDGERRTRDLAIHCLVR